MAAAVAVSPSPGSVGKPFTFAATGFAHAHAITLAVTGPDASFAIQDQATTDSSGNYTWTDEITAEEVGVLAYSVTDGTDTVQGRIQIWS
jgi:hypothetical protein